MSMTPFTIRPAYTDGDYLFTVTCDAMGSDTPIDEWTLSATLYDSSAEVVTTDVTLTVLSVDDYTLSVVIAGQELAFGDYPIVISRTNAGEEAVVFTGTLEVTDPTNQLAWGQGFYP